jgi:hypothetical protein
MKPRFTASDFKESARQSEVEYDRGKSSRWYNREVPSSLKPYMFVVVGGLAILTGMLYVIVDGLNSMIPPRETINVKIENKKYDPVLPCFVLEATKDDGVLINLWNKNSNLEKKINDSELQEALRVGETYKLEVSRPRQYPTNVYGNVLKILEER